MPSELLAYANVVLRLVVGLLIVLVYIRTAGRLQLAPVTAVDQIGNMALGGMVGTFVLDADSSIVMFIFMMVVWSALMIGLRWLKHKSNFIDELIDGHRIELVRDGAFLADGFKAAQLSVHEFVTKMNQRKIVSFDNLKSVWLEQDGQFTILLNEDEQLSVVLVEEGLVREENLEEVGLTREELEAELARRGFSSIDEVFCADWHDGRLWSYAYATSES